MSFLLADFLIINVTFILFLFEFLCKVIQVSQHHQRIFPTFSPPNTKNEKSTLNLIKVDLIHNTLIYRGFRKFALLRHFEGFNQICLVRFSVWVLLLRAKSMSVKLKSISTDHPNNEHCLSLHRDSAHGLSQYRIINILNHQKKCKTNHRDFRNCSTPR